MVDRELTVGGAAHVELDHVGPHLVGAPERSHGVLGERAGGPAVSDHGRHRVTIGRTFPHDDRVSSP